LGYKQHTRTDAEGYIEKLHITPANAHECKHLSPLLEGLPKGTTVYADKGYDSAENRQHLEEHQLLDGIMRKACRNRPLSEVQSLPQPPAVGSANQTQPIFVEDPLCG
ncbi:transposase, partial [Neisseria meningitidis NM576]